MVKGWPSPSLMFCSWGCMLPPATLRELSGILGRGGVIAYPTETLYGLGADPWNDAAVHRIFELKGRSPDKPLPLLLPTGDPERFGIQLTPLARRLGDRYWPGPVTLIVPATGFPSIVTAGTDTVAVRRSPLPFVEALLGHWSRPLVTTSANLSDQPSAVRGAEVLRAFPRGLDCIVDGGTLTGRAGSTIVDCTGDQPRVVRQGDVTIEL